MSEDKVDSGGTVDVASLNSVSVALTEFLARVEYGALGEVSCQSGSAQDCDLSCKLAAAANVTGITADTLKDIAVLSEKINTAIGNISELRGESTKAKSKVDTLAGTIEAAVADLREVNAAVDLNTATVAVNAEKIRVLSNWRFKEVTPRLVKVDRIWYVLLFLVAAIPIGFLTVTLIINWQQNARDQKRYEDNHPRVVITENFMMQPTFPCDTNTPAVK